MKKRIFGILLMGAMVVASMSMFTSCKDYDDDIQANKDDITALKTQLATVQTAASAAQSAAATAQSAADAAATAAKNAQTAADAAATAAKNAQGSADAAANAASENAKAIKAAQEAIAALEAQVAAFAKVEDLNAVKADLETLIANATAGKVSAEELTDALKPISAKIDAIDESLNTLTADVKALKDWKTTVEGQIASVLADLKSQDAAVKALQEEIKNKIAKGDLAGLANEEAVKAYVDNQLEVYAKSSDVSAATAEISAAVAEALKSYTTTAKLNDILNGYSTPDAVQTAITNALKSYYTVAKTDEMISDLTTAVKKAQETANAAQTEEQVRAIAQAIADEVSENAGDKINILNVLVTKTLRSLVLKPSYMFGGVEATQVPAIIDAPLYIQNRVIPVGTADGTNKNGPTTDWRNKAGTDPLPWTKTIEGIGQATYHVNPVGVDLSKYTLSFDTNTPQNLDITRAATDDFKAGTQIVDPDGANYTVNSAGNINVKFTTNTDAIKRLYVNNANRDYFSYLPMIALKASYTATDVDEANVDQTITSDWAMVLPTFYTNLRLADTGVGLAPAGTVRNAANTIINAAQRYNPNAAPATAPNAVHAAADAEGLNHLYTRFEDRADNNNNTKTIHSIVYDGSVDLTALVNTHANQIKFSDYGGGVVTVNSHVQPLSATLMQQLGLSYVFEAVDYIEGSNETRQSVRFNVSDPTNAYLMKINEDGTAQDARATADQGRNQVGRMPIVRVKLVKGSDVYAVGYLRFVVTNKPKETVNYAYNFNNTFYYNCVATNNEFAITWSMFEAGILQNTLNISQADFIAGYTLQSTGTVGGDRIARLYSDPQALNEITAANWPGIVTQTITNNPAAQTNILKWNFTAAELNQLFDDDAPGDTKFRNGDVQKDVTAANAGELTRDMTVYVKYTSNTATSPDLVVGLTIPTGHIRYAVGQIGTKIGGYWYDLNNGAANSGLKEIHATAGDPDRDAALNGGLTSQIGTPNWGFRFNAASTFQKAVAADTYNSIMFVVNKDAARYAALTPAMRVADMEFTYPSIAAGNAEFNASTSAGGLTYWTVRGNSGASYNLTLSADRRSIVLANATLTAPTATQIVEIVNVTSPTPDNTNGNRWVAEYKDNAVAKDILNYVKHDQMGSLQTFTGYVKASVPGVCRYLVTNPYFNIRYVRPITIAGNDGVERTDANGTQYISVMDLINFVDWRDMWKPTATVAAGDADYFRYYGVIVNVDQTQIRTDVMAPQATAYAYNDIANIEANTQILNGLTSEMSVQVVYSGATAGTYTGAANTIIIPHLNASDKVAFYENAPVIKYNHNEASVATFHLYIPVTVSYYWGNATQKFYAVVTMRKTTGGGNAARQK